MLNKGRWMRRVGHVNGVAWNISGMNKLFVCLLILIPVGTMLAGDIPMTSDNWTAVSFRDEDGDNGGIIQPITISSYGATINGTAYRQGTAMFSDDRLDLTNSRIDITWRCNENSSEYMGVGVGYGAINNGYDYLDCPLAHFTTNHSFNGSKVVSDNTWYYTSVVISDNVATVHTSTNNYYDNGGQAFDTKTVDLTSNSQIIADTSIYAAIYDNYGGTASTMTVAEVKIVPEPTTLGMLMMGGMAVLRRKRTGQLCGQSRLTST